jgi:glycosyltransferase involved in cell wall biosynthesis
MKNKKISVIVPTYNRPGLLQRTLASILDQSYESIETIVVNDAGDKGAEEVVGFFSGSENFGKSFDYFENKENKGLAGTRNVAMEKATGDYFVFLDDDDILLPYALEFRMNMMEKLDAEIVYTRALQDIWEKREQGYVSVHKQLYWDSHFDRDLILIQNIAPCCCPLFSRKAWDDSGNYKMDEKMTTTEDHDFWTALSRRTDFHELKLIDCECSYRKDKTQMSGSLNFVPNWIITFKRWRHTAKDLEYVKSHQNNILKRVGVNPEDYGL